MFSPVAVAAIVSQKEEEGEDVDEKETIKKKFPEKYPEKVPEKVYPCPECGFEFSRKFNRDKHMELIHKMPRPDLPPLYPEKVAYVEKEEPMEQTVPPLKRQEKVFKKEDFQKAQEKKKELSTEEPMEQTVPALKRQERVFKKEDFQKVQEKKKSPVPILPKPEAKPEKRKCAESSKVEEGEKKEKKTVHITKHIYRNMPEICVHVSCDGQRTVTTSDKIVLVPICQENI